VEVFEAVRTVLAVRLPPGGDTLPLIPLWAVGSSTDLPKNARRLNYNPRAFFGAGDGT
jgi:hypothetical protein